MAQIYAPTIDNTMTAQTIYERTSLDVAFFCNKQTNLYNYVLVRVEDAYGNSLFDRSIGPIAKYEMKNNTSNSTFYLTSAQLDDRKYIQIPLNELTIGSPTIGDYCHIFIKLLDSSVGDETITTSWVQWVNNANNASKQSDWSNAGVHYFVDTPKITLTQYCAQGWKTLGILTSSSSGEEGPKVAFIPNSSIRFRFEFSYANSLETDSIEWCNIHFATTINSSPKILTSGRLAPIARNTVEWTLPKDNLGSTGILYYTYKTKKGYIYIINKNAKLVPEYSFASTSNFVTAAPVQTSYIANKTQIKFYIAQYSSSHSEVIFNLERAPADDDDKWELIYQHKGPSTGSVTAIDATCALGVKYKYRYFWSNGAGQISVRNQIENGREYMCKSENILLTTKDQQLTLCLNPEVSGLKYNFKDTVTPTLGRRYPFLYRNKKQNYRTFTIGGMISQQLSENVCRNDATYWETPAWVEASTELNNEREIIEERIFRDKVLRFLEDGNVILFRSLQEGNMFIHLSNISLKPEKALGRMIYSFSATATEVCEASAENYVRYFKEGLDSTIKADIVSAAGNMAADSNVLNGDTGSVSGTTWSLTKTTVDE